jgi:hypothetical protein
MSYIQQFFTSRDNNANAETFVGQEGRLWWNPLTNQIYSSNGSTPGGVPLSGGGGNVTPGGSNSQVQFNDLNAFGGSANLTFDSGNGTLTASILSATGNVSGNYFIGNGSLLTGISVSSNRIFNGTSNVEIAANDGNITISAAAGNTWTFDTSGALTLPGATAGENIATQSGYITVGNLLIGQGGALFNSNNDSWALYGNLSDSGTTILIPSDADAGNGLALYFENQISNVEIRSGGTWVFDTAGNLTLPGNLTTTANITGGNVLTGGLISATGNITGNYILGNGSQLTGIDATSIQNGTSNVKVVGSGSNVTVNIGGTSNVVVWATTGQYVTGLISATGNVTAANVIVNGTAAAGSAVLVVSGNIQTTTANNTANIGNVSNYFNTVHAKATTAQYADVAELYLADTQYLAGTVLVFGGDQEVTALHQSHDPAIAGVVSENPSHLMNAGLQGVDVVPVALLGRVKCQVQGTIKKGDRLVASSTPGVAQRLDPSQYRPGCIIGKSLENYNSNATGMIEIAVGIK